jgi:hypothetical protein
MEVECYNLILLVQFQSGRNRKALAPGFHGNNIFFQLLNSIRPEVADIGSWFGLSFIKVPMAIRSIDLDLKFTAR